MGQAQISPVDSRGDSRRNSRQAASIFLGKINGAADKPRKKIRPFVVYIDFLDATSQFRRWLASRFFLPTVELHFVARRFVSSLPNAAWSIVCLLLRETTVSSTGSVDFESLKDGQSWSFSRFFGNGISKQATKVIANAVGQLGLSLRRKSDTLISK